MRSLSKAVLTALALGLAALLSGEPGAAQDAPALPKAPIPYSQTRPKPKPRRPAANPTAAAPAQAPRTPTSSPPLVSATLVEPNPVAPAPAPAARAPTAPLALASAPIPAADLQAFLDGWMADAMAREHIAGAAVSIVQNGHVVLKTGYGFADLAARRPVDPDRTLFRIGSISKTFTWILVMKDVETGRMRLDRPVNLYLPEKVRLAGKSRNVTLGNLMDHSAGFEDLALGQLFENDPRRVRPLDLYLRQERPDQVRNAGLLSSYSNYGVALAGAAAAQTAGKVFERRVEDDITVPLRMSHTTFREPRPERRGLPAAMPARLRGDVATGYGWRAAGFIPDDYEYIGQVAPAGGASSTAGDMSRYMLMLLGNGSAEGATIFGPVAARAFRTPLQRPPTGINGWAHGFMTFDLPGGHRGYGHLGHTIAFQSNMTLVPDLALGVFVTTNSESGARLADILPQALVQRFYAAARPFPRPGSAALVAEGSMFEGRYLSTRRAFGGLEGFVGLIEGQAEVSVTPGGRLLVSRNGGTQAFVPEGPLSDGRFISTTDEARLRFLVRDGRAVGYQPGTNTEILQRAAFAEQRQTLVTGAGLTASAAVATLLGLLVRNRRELRQNQTQARASLVQAMQAGLWIAAFVLFALWSLGAGDAQALMYNWPGALVVTASTCALVAASLTLLTIIAIPAIWQGGRRVESWTAGRKFLFTSTVLIYMVFSVLLALNGALAPWTG